METKIRQNLFRRSRLSQINHLNKETKTSKTALKYTKKTENSFWMRMDLSDSLQINIKLFNQLHLNRNKNQQNSFKIHNTTTENPNFWMMMQMIQIFQMKPIIANQSSIFSIIALISTKRNKSQ